MKRFFRSFRCFFGRRCNEWPILRKQGLFRCHDCGRYIWYWSGGRRTFYVDTPQWFELDDGSFTLLGPPDPRHKESHE